MPVPAAKKPLTTKSSTLLQAVMKELAGRTARSALSCRRNRERTTIAALSKTDKNIEAAFQDMASRFVRLEKIQSVRET
jgi:hypothetical protein